MTKPGHEMSDAELRAALEGASGVKMPLSLSDKAERCPWLVAHMYALCVRAGAPQAEAEELTIWAISSMADADSYRPALEALIGRELSSDELAPALPASRGIDLDALLLRA